MKQHLWAVVLAGSYTWVMAWSLVALPFAAIAAALVAIGRGPERLIYWATKRGWVWPILPAADGPAPPHVQAPAVILRWMARN